jgi:ferritin-like metal-binding protein YciE
MLRSPAARALLIGVTLGVIQQFAGINAVIAYAPSILERTGLNASSSILCSLAVGVANVVATIAAVRLVDRRGRRPLLLASAAGTSASLLVLGLSSELSPGGWASGLSLLGLLAYIAAFALGLGPVFWLLIAEIFPLEARAAGVGAATAVNWFSSFLVGLLFVPLVDAIGQGPTFWVFAGVCALGCAFVARFVPETRGRTLGEIQAEVAARFSPIPRPPTAAPRRKGTAMLLDRIDTPAELFAYKLGAALTMEKHVLAMLGDLERETRHDELKRLFNDHAAETEEHIANLGRAFAAIDEEADEKPCPAMKGLELESKANIKLTKGRLVDDVILAGAAETEHHEIAVYEELIMFAETLGKPEVVALLRRNLDQERHTLEQVQSAARAIAEETFQPA